MRESLSRRIFRTNRERETVQVIAERYGDGLPQKPVTSGSSKPIRNMSLGDKGLPDYIRQMAVQICRDSDVNPGDDTTGKTHEKLSAKWQELQAKHPCVAVQSYAFEHHFVLRIELDSRRVPAPFQDLVPFVWKIKVKMGSLWYYFA